MVGCRVVYVHFSDALRDLLPFVKFKKREKHAWNSVTFSKDSGCSLKVKVLRGCLSRFLKCANGTNQQFVSYLPCNRGELHGRLKRWVWNEKVLGSNSTTRKRPKVALWAAK